MNKKTIVTLGIGTLAAVGIGLAGTSIATAETQPTTPSTSTSLGSQSAPPANGNDNGNGNGNTDPSKPMRSDETLLTGDVAAKVTAAAKAKEPTATIERVETDSDGVYEAHMKRTDGTEIVVQIDRSYAVTSVQEMGPGGPGGHSGPGGAPGAPAGSDSTGSAGTGSSPTDANGTTTPAA